MEKFRKELNTIIEQIVIIQQDKQDQYPTRAIAASSLIREETIQNNKINNFKDHEESTNQIVQQSRLQFLRKLQEVYNNEQKQDDHQQLNQYMKNFQNNYGYLGEDRLYPWQLIQSIDILKQFERGLSFLSDKNLFLNGRLVYAILKDAFMLYFDIELSNVFESFIKDKDSCSIQNQQLDEKELEKVWNNIISNDNTMKKTIFFLNLEYLTPDKIIFIAKLQKHLEIQINSLPNIIIYSDDILSAQLKQLCKPQIEIILDLQTMPQKIIYAEQQQQQQQKQKFDQVEKIIINSLKKYKQNLMRFDFLIFIKNAEESQYLKEHHLRLIRENLNLIDLTDEDIENEEVPFFEEDFKKQWIETEQLRKQKERIDKERIQQEQEQAEIARQREEKKREEFEKAKFQEVVILQQEKPEKKIPELEIQPEIDIKPEAINDEIPVIQQHLNDIPQLQVIPPAQLQQEQQNQDIPQEKIEKKDAEQKQNNKQQKQEEEQKTKEEEEKLLKELEEERLKEQQRYQDDLSKHIYKNKSNLYKKNEFNVFLAKSHKQLRHHQLNKILIQIDTGEALKVYFMDTIFESVPVVSSKITREEALKRERLIGHSSSCQIYRLYERKEFLRLQKRDFLNLINLEQFKFYQEIVNEKCQEKQAIRILLYVLINLSENWFSCSSEISAHVSIIWSRMGDIFSLYNSFQLISKESSQYFSYYNLEFQSTLEKNQINSHQFDKIVHDIQNVTKNLNLQINPIKILKDIDSLKFSEMIQQIVIEKYYKNLCVYSGHRRHGFRHFQSGSMIHYADMSSMNLIQERPFLIIPLQLQINQKNHYEIKQCICIDHPFLLENAPSQFIDKYQLRLLKRQSLNLHEIEYFGISDALFQYFEANKQIIKDIEKKYDCYYEPNHHMDTITLHCDASQKEKVEKCFNSHMETAKEILSEEIMEISHGNNSILKIQKGGVIKEIIILQNDHIFIVDNLPPTTQAQDLIDLFSEYGDILNVKFFTDLNSQNTTEKSISAEILVSETEDSQFFIETFNQIEFQGRIIQLRQKNHQYKIHQDNDSTKYHVIFRWQTWKSKLTGRIEFEDESSVSAFMRIVQNKLSIDEKDIKAEIDKTHSKTVLLSGLSKNTDELTIKKCLSAELQKNIVKICVDRIADVDRGISKTILIHALNKVQKEQHQIVWVRKKENGIIEAKMSFPKNQHYKMNTYYEKLDGKPDYLGQQKMYVQRYYIQTFNFEYKLKNIAEMILKGNQQLVEMQQQNQIVIKEKVVRPIPSKQDFLVILKCTNEENFNKAKVIIQAILSSKMLDLRNVFYFYKLKNYLIFKIYVIQQIKLDLASLFDEEDQVDYSQIFTEIGQKKLRELEKKYPVYFKINLLKEDVRVFCTDPIFELINKEVEYFLRQSIRVKIPISGKNIRNILGIDGRGLEEFKNKSQLTKIQLDYISKDVYMEGNSKKVDQAKNALLALLEEKNSSSCFNNMPYSYEDCQVCSNTIQTGYRLQGCGHKFCISCIMFVIDNSLGDVNSLPIKCPFCSKAIIMKDIKALMNEEQIQKMTRMALNHYVQNNFSEVNFCVNENCKSIHSSKLTKYTCYECSKTFCSKCSAEYHYGMTCTVYQETEAKNIEFLIKEGARKCPKCGVYIIRIDGCYRVECRRCTKHICWKDNCMNFYDTAQECYNHLDEKHGGYW